MDKNGVKSMKYEVDDEKRINFITSCTNAETLHLYAYNYNWGTALKSRH